MTSTASFDLEPEQDESPLDWQAAADQGEHTDPRMPPARAGLRRTRTGRGAGDGGAGQDDPAPTGRSRYFRWLISATFYYVVGLLSALGMLLAFFNPYFGTVSPSWWLDVLQANGLRLPTDPAASLAAGLVLCIVGATVGLWLKRWRYRPAFMVFVFSIPLYAGMYILGPLALYWLLGAALLGGLLLSAARRRRRGQLLAASLLLAGLMFVPWGGPTQKSRDFSFSPWSYGSAAASAAPEDAEYTSPATMALDAFEDGADPWRHPWATSTVLGLAILALGLLAWMGLGGAWVPWAAGLLLLGFYAWTTAEAMASAGNGWQAGVAAWAEAIRHGAIFLLLPLAAAVSEVRAPGKR